MALWTKVKEDFEDAPTKPDYAPPMWRPHPASYKVGYEWGRLRGLIIGTSIGVWAMVGLQLVALMFR